MTLNGVMALFCVISANSGSFRAHCVKVHVRYLISWWVPVLHSLAHTEPILMDWFSQSIHHMMCVRTKRCLLGVAMRLFPI